MTSRVASRAVVRILLPLIALGLAGCRTWSTREEQAAALFNEGNALREAGRLTEAADAYLGALERDPLMHAAAYNRALVLADLGEYDLALDGLEALSAEDPDNLVILRAAAWVSWSAGRSGDALGYYLKALAVVPVDRSALEGACTVYESLGRPGEAVEFRRLIVELDDRIETRMDLARTLKAAARYAEAHDEYRIVLLRDSRHAEALEGASFCASETGDARTAMAYDLRITELGGGQPVAWWRIARTQLLVTGEYQRGLDALKTALESGYSDRENLDELVTESPPAIRSAVRNLLGQSTSPAPL